MKLQTHARGFTLIELVVVISIIAILAAFAIPRFINLETQARNAAVGGLEGSVRSAAALAHSLAVATGATASVTMESQTVNLTNGYPDLASIDLALSTRAGFDYDDTTGVFSKVGAPTPATCGVTYAAAPPMGVPTITPNTGGC